MRKLLMPGDRWMVWRHVVGSSLRHMRSEITEPDHCRWPMSDFTNDSGSEPVSVGASSRQRSRALTTGIASNLDPETPFSSFACEVKS